MSSILKKYNGKIKEGFSKKLPSWAIILIIIASLYAIFVLLTIYSTFRNSV